MTKLEKVLTFSYPRSTGKAEMKAWSRKQPPNTFPPKNQKHIGRFSGAGGRLCQVLASLLLVQAIVLPPSQERVPGLLARLKSPLLSEDLWQCLSSQGTPS